MAETILLKVSRQGQITLRRNLRKALGDPQHLSGRLEDGALVLRPAIAATPEEAEALFGRQGITREVLVEALRMVARRRARSGAA